MCVCVRIPQDGSNTDTTVLGVEPILTPGVVVSWKLLLPFRLDHNYVRRRIRSGKLTRNLKSYPIEKENHLPNLLLLLGSMLFFQVYRKMIKPTTKIISQERRSTCCRWTCEAKITWGAASFTNGWFLHPEGIGIGNIPFKARKLSIHTHLWKWPILEKEIPFESFW